MNLLHCVVETYYLYLVVTTFDGNIYQTHQHLKLFKRKSKKGFIIKRKTE